MCQQRLQCSGYICSNCILAKGCNQNFGQTGNKLLVVVNQVDVAQAVRALQTEPLDSRVHTGRQSTSEIRPRKRACNRYRTQLAARTQLAYRSLGTVWTPVENCL